MNVRPLVPQAANPTSAATRPSAMVLVWDRDSEGVIRQSMSDLGISDVEFITGGIEAAITLLGQRASPRLLVVDITRVADPSAQIDRLAEVCEPGVGVIVIGQNNDIRLYRDLLEAGITEYFFKPLVGNLLSRTFNKVLTGSSEQKGSRAGRLVFVLAARGGDGATTIATNMAWRLAEVGQRRVVYLDLDLQFGDAALAFDAKPTHALREALEHPDRVDELFLQRGVTPVTERLGILGALEPLNSPVQWNDEAVLTLLDKLLHRYRYVFVDVPTATAPAIMKTLALPSTLLLVSAGTLAAARDVVRWRQQFGPNTPERATIHVLNKTGSHAALPMADFVRAVGQPPNIILPYDRDIALGSKLGIASVRETAGMRRSLAPLYRQLTGEPVEQPHSFFGRIFQ